LGPCGPGGRRGAGEHISSRGSPIRIAPQVHLISRLFFKGGAGESYQQRLLKPFWKAPIVLMFSKEVLVAS